MMRIVDCTSKDELENFHMREIECYIDEKDPYKSCLKQCEEEFEKKDKTDKSKSSKTKEKDKKKSEEEKKQKN